MVFLSNWLVYKVVLAAVVADEEVVAYPLAGDFTLHFDGNDTLYFSGGSKEFASNVTIYQGSNTFAVNDTSDIFINKTGTYYAEMDVCGGRFKTNEVTVSSITDYKVFSNDSQTKILAADGAAGDTFGVAVSISGDYAIIGSPYDDDTVNASGSAYIFYKDPDNGWEQQGKLVANDPADSDLFGISVDISGDLAIVGSMYKGSSEGAAYIFYNNPSTGWSQLNKITPSVQEAGATFGKSVSISGNYAIIGANSSDEGGSNKGSAYIFYNHPDNGWEQHAKLVPTDSDNEDEFGTAVAISGDYAVVSSPYDDDTVNASGSVYVFYNDPDNGWEQQAKLVA